MRDPVRWAVEWHSRNKLDGDVQYFMWTLEGPRLFRTRREAREWIFRQYGYILRRPDVRKEPHGWRLPRPVKVRVVLTRVGR